MRHTCEDTALLRWECVASRLQWELMTRMEAAQTVPNVIPEALDYKGFVDTLVAYASHETQHFQGATHAEPEVHVDIHVRNPFKLYGANLRRYLWEIGRNMKWVDDAGQTTRRFPGHASGLGPPGGVQDLQENLSVTQYLNDMLPSLTVHELKILGNHLRRWPGLSSLAGEPPKGAGRQAGDSDRQDINKRLELGGN